MKLSSKALSAASSSRGLRRSGRRRAIAAMLGAVAAPRLFGQAAPSQGTNRRVFENDQLWATHFRFPPKAVIAMHEVTPSLMIYLTDSSARFSSRTGRSWEENVKAGEVRWWAGGWVRTEILSSHPIEFIRVVPK